MNRLTQSQVYSLLHEEYRNEIAFTEMKAYPAGDITPSRKAHICAVNSTWYWYNNQDKLLNFLHYARLTAMQMLESVPEVAAEIKADHFYHFDITLTLWCRECGTEVQFEETQNDEIVLLEGHRTALS